MSRAAFAALIAAGIVFVLKRATDSYTPGVDVVNVDFSDGSNDVAAANPEAIVDAFLYAIRASEHTAATIANGTEYSTFYGGKRFVDMSNHPSLTGEIPGVPLPASVCIAAGFGPGCVSTAAGAYQINLPTWQQFGAGLPDFTPESQDAAARRILDYDGVTPLLLQGEIAQAIYAAAGRWASLPGSTANQSGRSLKFVVDKIEAGLARFA
jgi:muramidase (phage lysozyme)